MPSRASATLALCCGLSVAGFGARASAYSCQPPRELLPQQGAEVPGTAQILDICYYYTLDGKPTLEPLCGMPVLEDSAGRRIELFEEQQSRSVSPPAVRRGSEHGITADRPASPLTPERSRVVRWESPPAVGRGVARRVTAYRPASALTPGRYRVSATQYSLLLSNEFSVVEGVARPPALPVLSSIDFALPNDAGLAVIFAFEPFDGSLAVERDGLVREPFEALDISGAELPLGQPREFWLVNMLCQVNFPELDFGVSTTLRFGVLDDYGSFSGWTEPLLYTVPTQEEYDAEGAAERAAQRAKEEAAEEAALRTGQERAKQAFAETPGWCSFSLLRPAPPSGSWPLALAALTALFVSRSLSRRRS